ncbi:ornithine carbamoyltransferase [Egibacter rhizosphaerae]|uniref:Ornithine carbamoyltransferase n=1 Tax=Egibacter rhizosphaerae TaxID=1670831 RepID=A0A411YK61_9ACTN|nr:ornithine carbamoyltransferase [Egibacter rhizosphaerae]QBI21570.1 ornithine carbamoyltransferase [Egibacter rhizosphaerae]
MTRHFLTVEDLSRDELLALLDRADALKAQRTTDPGGPHRFGEALAGRTVALLFEKPSTRTRLSFEVAVRELGGHPLPLSSGELQLGRGETIGDTARVMSRYVHAVVLRTFGQDRLIELATHADVPIVNALSDLEHPCQALADLQTVRAHTGGLEGRRLVYLGDGNNVAHSLLVAGALTGLSVTVAAPVGYEPDGEVLARARGLAESTGAELTVTNDPNAACDGADAVYTDVWASMGQEAEAEDRVAAFRPFQLDRSKLDRAADHAVALHCLPAHRGEEITDEVIDGPRSVVWEQAENRLHTQKALLLDLLSRGAG